ncbi:1,3-beta-galactosyl-N-acetylhexosamine phosphorylase [Erysipelothrix rhusiopathiae]|nr:1,3-beta-galactosyl-N-acetylhexosamine phosphorylase [Erysipelothrix rhusiopathiae]MDE8192131.1 1,3-beta-galactosyl-N-acetylhexosamine phosphorylase [Erysipelothrix rhusiopathiae]MDE8241729.1 1,3-beta-galactosyl-N-acetylhexosamine phosphorylase [Erysipelothrix rhusiopathiae]MDE8244620.1 1,3-beta-galactosyl-N-acetylhexosamine phosphorylase [Erysipelothrix rhusiopathiae]MDE8248276.1 1,3-beta-galactosyl-N-acetylhexosamine phosphorylase [Erysipelothrix rhusiopathiae]
MKKNKGRVTLPSENNFLEETKDLMERWGADALRDSDGTKLDKDLKNLDAKIYTTYFVARGQNEFALQHITEAQQIFLMSDYHLAIKTELEIPFMTGYLREQLSPDYNHDPKVWWQVIDRTRNEVVDVSKWEVDSKRDVVVIKDTEPFHEYTVNFLSYMIWDPTQMYNYITNDWKDREKEIPFDVRQPHSQKFMLDTLKDFLETNPKTDVIRFTTFYYHFTLCFNDQRKEKFVDWFGYGSSVSPRALEAFEKAKGYRLTAEDFIQNGYYNSTFCMPTQTYKDYIDFQQQFVAQQAKAMVDLVHSYGKEAMMFLGDNWIGVEPYGAYFHTIGLDAVVGSVGGGMTLRLISDIPHVKYTEGRFLPYFFPDTFFEGNDDAILKEANDNWISARRALMRSPLNRIGYGGYPSLAYKFPKFVDYIAKTADEFRGIIDKIEDVKPMTKATIGIMSAWGSLRSWQNFMVAHALHYKQIYSYIGILESLSGMDVDVRFLSFDEIKSGIPSEIDVLINAGDAKTSFSGDVVWSDPAFVAMIRKWVYEGHGFIGVGEPSAFEKGGHFFQLHDVLGVDKELGFTLSTDKYFKEVLSDHFITHDLENDFNYGEAINNVYARTADTEIIKMDNENVTIAAKSFGRGRGVYLSGLPYSFENTRILYRSIFYAMNKENQMKRYFASNIHCEVNVYPRSVALLNNTHETQKTIFYDGLGKGQEITLEPSEIKWGERNEETVEWSY